MKNLDSNDSFWSWLRHEKFSVGLALLIFIIPYLYQLPMWINGTSNEWKKLELIYDVCHVIFIFVSLVLLANSAFLMDVNEDDNKNKLFTYVQDVFGENSKIAQNGQDGLFKIVSFTIKQFYFSWIIVWCIWLLLYLNNLIYYLYRYFEASRESMFRFSCFFENFLNLINSFVLLFIYFVITISSVSVSTNRSGRKQLHMSVIFLVFLSMIYFPIDFMSIFSDKNYDIIQFYLKMFVGIIATVSLMGVLGRLNSSFLNIPQSLIIALYVYASLQMLYPITYENYGRIKICLNEYNAGWISHMLYILAFAGKVCLFFVLRWIIQKRRFMFFVIHKAHSMIEAEDMVKRFNRFMNE